MKWLLLTLVLPLCWCTAPRKGADKADALPKDSIPACFRQILNDRAKEIPPALPLSISTYKYEGKVVYYFKESCCDKFNVVYDDSCHLLGAPDGGFTGRGDGKLPGFFEKAKLLKQIWKGN